MSKIAKTFAFFTLINILLVWCYFWDFVLPKVWFFMQGVYGMVMMASAKKKLMVFTPKPIFHGVASISFIFASSHQWVSVQSTTGDHGASNLVSTSSPIQFVPYYWILKSKDSTYSTLSFRIVLLVTAQLLCCHIRNLSCAYFLM